MTNYIVFKEEKLLSNAVVTLKKGEGRALKQGGAWIFDNEIASILGAYENGDIVLVRDFDGYPMGRGFINEHSKIRIRMMTRNIDQEIDEAFLKKRVQDAWEYRKKVTDTSSCRLIFGEADFLPGLVVDKYEDVLVVESLALGIDRMKETIVGLLKETLAKDGIMIRGVYERSDAKVRLKEGLPRVKGFIGEPFATNVEIVENGVHYMVDLVDGQKTGFFLDQKYNRQAIAKIAKGKHVLDCFTHTGAFALNAAAGGAAAVPAVDLSAEAVQMTDANASKNGLDKVVKGLKANVFDLLSELVNNKSREYDFIILDPPAFTKSGSTVKNAIRGYKEINLKAMKLLPRGGYLATCSCSHFMKEELFVQMLHDAAADANVQLRQIEARQQSPDHPILWNVPETYYLKFYIFQVV